MPGCPRFKWTILFIVLAACGVIILLGLSQCMQQNKTTDELMHGKELSKRYCQNCHQYPEANLIDKKHWEQDVLPAMGTKLGLTYWGSGYFAGKKSGIAIADWFRIVNYYTKTAPAKLLNQGNNQLPLKDWGIFKLKTPQQGTTDGATTTMLSFDTVSKQLYSADAQNNVYVWADNLLPKLISKLPSPATDAVFLKSKDGKHEMLITCIGTLAPVDIDTGKLVQVYLAAKNKKRVMITNLPRPVQTVTADIDNDRINEYIVCGFGHNNGGLYLLKQMPDGNLKRETISPMPGASHVVTGDFNHDGYTDLICLFAQSDEGIWLFTNNRKGGFIRRNLLRFPPVYGSSSFQLADMDRDGALDIVYTAGDNADLSPIPKPYHGVYVFINDGRMHFTQKYFYHMNGCTKAIAADFRKSGQLDIVAIAFFAEKTRSERGFVYLEQVGKLKFTPHQLPIQDYGKWLTMDVNDYNKDGFLDVALGSCSFNNLDRNNKENAVDKIRYTLPLIVLQNQLGHLKHK